MEAATPPAVVTETDYPLRFDVEYPEKLSHWKVLLKWLFAIPQFIVVYLLQIVLGVMVFIAFFAILFTKRWPQGMWDFAVQIERWTANVIVYGVLLMRDEYPPFNGEPGEYPVTFEIDQPEELSRLMIFVKWLLVIPHLIVLFFVWLASLVVLFIAFFAILFTGRYPRGMFDFLVGAMRWSLRVNAYGFVPWGGWLQTDRYPPFALK
jgi:hypothetical protein